MFFKRLIAAVFLLFNLGSMPFDNYETAMIGIAMPTDYILRWERDGEYIKTGLEEAGFSTMTAYANDNAALQVSQLENMITDGCEAIIVAPVDSDSLSSVLSEAKDKGIYIISYDRPITDTPNIDFHVTFDEKSVGKEIAQYVTDNVSAPINLEIALGPLSDNRTGPIYDGMMEVLKPYLDNGTIVIPSGQVAAEQTSVQTWEVADSQARMENILNDFYSDKKIDAIVCTQDMIARGAADAVLAAGYSAGAADYPIIIGQDCEIMTIRYMNDGKQSMSLFKSTTRLGDRAVEAVIALLSGSLPASNGVFYNGAIDVPTFNCELAAVTMDNYKEVLVDGGYYTAEELGL
jgi:putative multiple sugar transport system substrate-binding protein